MHSKSVKENEDDKDKDKDNHYDGNNGNNDGDKYLREINLNPPKKTIKNKTTNTHK